MAKSKSKDNLQFFLFLFFFLARLTNPSTVPDVDESQVKSWVVERRSSNVDLFAVNMKSNHTCYHEWCRFKFFAVYRSISNNKRYCSCTCQTAYPSFSPSMRRCIDASLAASFGGCDKYFDDNTLLNKPVNLMTAKPNNDDTFKFRVSNGETCTLIGSYFHDYISFESHWEKVADGFFTLDKQGNKYELKWKADNEGKLSGRIIRINVTCSTSTGCFLFKALGSVTYYASTSSSISSTSSYKESYVKPLTSTTSLIVAGSTSSPLSLSSSLMQPASPSPSTSLPSPSSSLSVSILSSTLLAISSSLSPSPSLVMTTSYSSVQRQITRLPALSTGEIPSTSKAELQSSPSFHSGDRSSEVVTTKIPQSPTSVVALPIEPSKTSSTVSASSTAGKISPGDNEKQTGRSNNGIVIGAAVGGAVVLGLVVLVLIIIFWKRRKAGKSTEKQSKQVKNPVYGTSGNDIQLERSKGSQSVQSHAQDTQCMYQGLVISNAGQINGKATYSSPGDEYDNCTVYHNLNKQTPGSPVYQSLMMGKDEPAQTITKPNSRANSKDATGLPKLKPGATGKPSQKSSVTPEPVYNVLDESGSDQGTTSEDLYNVLEGPDSGNDYEDANADGLYHALEGPNTAYEAPDVVLGNPGPESGHMYPFLLGPDANQDPPASHDEPLYNVVEGPDSDGTNQPGPNKPCPAGGLDNPSYEQTLELDQPYATVQQPGTQRESLYQPLRGPTHDLYEALG